MGYKAGAIAEKFFSSLLYTNGVDYRFVDDWYDYDVQGHKVELKSCRITIKGITPHRVSNHTLKIGRFDFTNKENKEKQIKEKVWIALVVRHYNQCIFYGFLNSTDIPNRRYLTLHQLRNYKVLSFKDWMQQHQIKQDIRPCPHCGRELVLE